MIYNTPPPGWITAPWYELGMSRQNFYQGKLMQLWETGPLMAHRTTGNAPLLFAADEVAKLRYWLFVRDGLIALGRMKVNDPLLPPFDLLAWFEDDPHSTTCPHCGGEAVTDNGRVWCRGCGVSQP